MKIDKKKPVETLGPIARTVAEIAAGPHCPKCGRSNRRGDHECVAIRRTA